MSFKPLLEKAQEHLARLEYREANQIYQQILAEDPNHAVALQATGQIAYQVSNYEAAEDYFQKSLAQNPNQYRIWILLGETCTKLRKGEKGLQAYRNAITLQPETSEAYLRLGNALVNTGENEEAAVNFEKAFFLDQASSSAFRRLAMIKKDLKIDSDVAKEAKRRIEEGLVEKEAMAHLHYGFAYLYERLGNDEKFFEHLHQANRFQKEVSPDWQGAFDKNAASIKATFTSETLKKTVPAECKIYSPIFIFGMPRSGTTLTEQIIASHPKVYGADEVDTLARFVVNQAAIWTQKPLLAGINDLNLEQLKVLSHQYQARMQKIAPGWDYITDKFLANYLAIGLIKMIMPWAKLIKLERHPMDIALSVYRNYFLETLSFCFNLKDLARFYCLYNDMIAFWEDLAPGFVYGVKYERLVTDFEPEVRKLIDFCGLPWDPACLEPHKTERSVLTLSQDQVRRPVYKSSLGKWKKFEKHLDVFRQECLKYGVDVDAYDGR